MKLNFSKYLTLSLLVIFISSCANIEITKRRYRPGYHIDVVKKNDRDVKVEETAVVNEAPTAESDVADAPPAKINSRKAERIAKREARRAKAEIQLPADEPMEAKSEGVGEILEVKPFDDIDKKTRENAFTFQKNRVQSKLRKAFKPEEDKSAWSVVSFIAMGLGIAAFVMFLLTLVTLVGILSAGGPLTSVWIFGLIGMLLGIGGMVTGIIGMRDTRDKKGRGFALAGMIAGIVGLVFGLIFFFWGMIFDLILGEEI